MSQEVYVVNYFSHEKVKRFTVVETSCNRVQLFIASLMGCKAITLNNDYDWKDEMTRSLYDRYGREIYISYHVLK